MPRTRLFSPRTWRRIHENVEGYAYISPWIIGFLVFLVGPLFASIYLSFTEYDILSSPRWVGWANYSYLLFQDDYFYKSFLVTLKYVAMAVPVGLVGSLAVALLLNQKLFGMGLYRTIYYLPTVVPAVAATMIWMWIFNPEFGILNLALKLVGIKGPHWLQDSRTALPALAIMSLWGIGGRMVIFLAGLQGIPDQLYEAASIDGARRWGLFKHVTLPLLSPTIFFNLITGLIGAFQVFTTAYILGGGWMGQAGPNNSLLFYALYLYQNAFMAFRMGRASAQAWLLAIVILGVTLLQFYLAKRWVYYEDEKGAKVF